MRRQIKSSLFVAVLLLALVPGAMADNIRDVVNALETPFRVGTPSADAIHDVETEFSQEATIVSLDRTQSGHGQVSLKFERRSTDRVPVVKFRWEYDFPMEQEIVSDGRTMWVHIPDNNQVIESDISETTEARPQDPLTFLTGLGNLSRDFLVRWAEPSMDADGNYALRLVPKTTTTMFRQLEVVVDRDAVKEFTRSGSSGRYFPIVSTKAVDPNGNTTVIRFDKTRMRINRGIPDMNFRFRAPAGVDVIRPSGQHMGY